MTSAAKKSKPSLPELAQRMVEVRAKLDEAQARATELQKEWDNLRKVQIPDTMEEMGVESVRLSGIGTLSLRTDAYCSTREGKGEELQSWLRDEGMGDLIKPAVNASTLKAQIRRMFEQGEPIPEELVNFQPYTYATVTKR